MKDRIICIALALALLFLSATGVFASEKKVLHMLTALDTNEAKIYIEAFEKATGIKVEWVRMSAGECLARLKAESKNPQFSVWFGGPSPEYVAAAQSNLLEPFTPPGSDFLKPQYRDKDWNWVGFYFGAIGFACNTDWFKKNNLPYPTSWQDLLKPEFKGQISFAYPYTSGTSYTILATIVQLMGEERGFDYMKKLDANVHHYNKSGSACVTQAGLGEIAIGISFSHDVLAKGTSKGYPVKLIFPSEGTGYEIGAMAVVKGGPEPELARQFITWALSTECQDLMQQWFRIPLNPKARVAKGAVTPDQVKLINYDDIWAGQNQARLVEKWRSLLNK
ncbi:MAG TPA: ABC transporter substrate-binding protein [Firmicutes bacterium]|nr:ABC transporter substrate-binding protein [Bacillota bacterium]